MVEYLLEQLKNNSESMDELSIELKKNPIKTPEEIDWFVFSVLNSIVVNKYQYTLEIKTPE